MTMVKDFLFFGQRNKIKTLRDVTNEELDETIAFLRRSMGYVIYPRWDAARLMLAEANEQVRLRIPKYPELGKHNVKRAYALMEAELNKLVKAHMANFNDEFLEAMASELSAKAYPKICQLRGDLGGLLMNAGVNNYLFYQYLQVYAVLVCECVHVYDHLMREARQKWGMDFSKTFEMFSGRSIYGRTCMWLSAIEDVIGERFPEINANNTMAYKRMVAIDDIFTTDDNVLSSIREAVLDTMTQEEKDEEVRKKLSQKFKVIAV